MIKLKVKRYKDECRWMHYAFPMTLSDADLERYDLETAMDKEEKVFIISDDYDEELTELSLYEVAAFYQAIHDAEALLPWYMVVSFHNGEGITMMVDERRIQFEVDDDYGHVSRSVIHDKDYILTTFKEMIDEFMASWKK